MAEKNSDLLLTPVAKKNSKFKREYPFPIVTSQCKENEHDPNWEIAEGFLHDNFVLVHNEKSMKMLYCMGFFGKGTLSKNAPRICFQEKTTESEKQKLTSAASSPVDDIIDLVHSDDEGSKSKLKTSNEDVVLISDDPSDKDDCGKGNDSSDYDCGKGNDSSDYDCGKGTDSSDYDCGKGNDSSYNDDCGKGNDSSDNDDCGKGNDSKQSDSEGKESLQLSFQEAFFLSYGLGCLVVKNEGKILNLLALWTKFCELTPSGNFPVMYTAYHHFRSKGWIVKNGLKFGTDYVLYKDGPPFYHSTYSVIVRALKENLTDARGNRELTWASLAALNRVNSAAGKGLLILYVIKPKKLTESILSTPFCISQFELEEVLYKRWVPEENR